MKNKSIILLSGGLDSLVSLGLAYENNNTRLALTFDYGQKALEAEIAASKRISKYYNLEHKIIKLDWLNSIINNALVSDNIDLPDGEFPSEKSAEAVWIPNRNALFLNIAAAFVESENFTHIIIGANKEEAQTFPDNSPEFIDRINALFEYSTLQKPKLIAPLLNYDKNDIVKIAIENGMPLELIHSCYSKELGHCGKCESCVRLKKALIVNKANQYLDILFKDGNVN